MAPRLLILISALVLILGKAYAQDPPHAHLSGTCDAAAGPVIAIDDAHKNSQRSNFRGLMELLQAHGFCVLSFATEITPVSPTKPASW
jgi:hypothetical protein